MSYMSHMRAYSQLSSLASVLLRSTLALLLPGPSPSLRMGAFCERVAIPGGQPSAARSM